MGQDRYQAMKQLSNFHTTYVDRNDSLPPDIVTKHLDSEVRKESGQLRHSFDNAKTSLEKETVSLTNDLAA